MKKYFFVLFLLLNACATTELTPTGLQLMTESQYVKVIDTYSDRVETYNGLYNAVNASGTIVNSKVAIAQVDQSARLYQWDQTKFNTERLAALDKISKETQVFLSFYTPEKKHDDLSKFNTIWKMFLDVDGRRYEGKATKMKQQTVEVQGLYRNHTRFSTPYMITFPVPVQKIENFDSKLVLTGPAGSAQLSFQKVIQ